MAIILNNKSLYTKYELDNKEFKSMFTYWTSNISRASQFKVNAYKKHENQGPDRVKQSPRINEQFNNILKNVVNITSHIMNDNNNKS